MFSYLEASRLLRVSPEFQDLSLTVRSLSIDTRTLNPGDLFVAFKGEQCDGHDFLAAVADWFDRWIIAGFAVRGTHGTTELAGRALRLLQTGNLQTYAFLFALGVALVLYLVLK